MGADRDPALAAASALGFGAFTDHVARAMADHSLPPVEPEHRHVNLLVADMLVQAIKDAGDAAGGAGQNNRLRRNGREIVEKALADYDGPCSQAYAEVLSAYISAPPGGRDALFLAVAARAVGFSPPSPGQIPSPASLDAAARAPLPESDQAELAAWARSTLWLLSRLTQQERS